MLWNYFKSQIACGEFKLKLLQNMQLLIFCTEHVVLYCIIHSCLCNAQSIMYLCANIPVSTQLSQLPGFNQMMDAVLALHWCHSTIVGHKDVRPVFCTVLKEDILAVCWQIGTHKGMMRLNSTLFILIKAVQRTISSVQKHKVHSVIV